MIKPAPPKWMFYRFLIWLVLVLGFIVAFGFLVLKGLPLNSNILDLLPPSSANPVAAQASEQFSNTMGDQVLFLVGNPDPIKAQQAVQTFVSFLQNSHAFKSITYKITTDAQQAWGSFYFPYRLQLLTPSAQALLKAGKLQVITQNALFNLYSPMGLSNSALLENDPFFLFQNFITALPKPASHLDLRDQYLMAQAPGQWYVMINAQIQGGSFSLSNQNQLIKTITQAEQIIKAKYSNSSLLKTGVLFYAKAGTDQAQHDISTIGLGSIIGIILLLIWTFRSLSPLVFTLFSSAIGFIAAFVMTDLIFGSVYLFTLVFGASLIGISVDYAFFYYADRIFGGPSWQPLAGLRRIFPGISLGLLNVVLAFLVIALAPFPGLRQLAVFAITGLLLSYATVVCAFPYMLKAKQQHPTPLLLKLSNAYLALWKGASKRSIIIIYIVLAAFVGVGLFKLHSNDDIRILQTQPPALLQDEQTIKTLIGSDMGMNFIVVQGATPEQTLAHAHQVTQTIKTISPEQIHPYIALSDYLPTVASQQENYALTQTLLTNQNLLPYLIQLGMAPDKAKTVQQQLSSLAFKPLTLAAWLASPVSDSLRYLWLGAVQGQYTTIVLLANTVDGLALKKALQTFSFVTYVDKAAEVSSIFKDYRKIISGLLAVAFSILLLLLTLRYGFKRAKYYFIPPVSACLLGIAVLGWMGVPLTLFNILALVLVLGLAVDYILFFAESRATYQSTMLAVLLSALTTVLSFGLLAFSATPVIHYFGVTVFVGVVSAFLLAPLVVRIRPEQKDLL